MPQTYILIYLICRKYEPNPSLSISRRGGISSGFLFTFIPSVLVQRIRSRSYNTLHKDPVYKKSEYLKNSLGMSTV
jgi:hypothetical protein